MLNAVTEMPLEIASDIANVSRETLEKLRHYHELLLKWQERINLISPNTVQDAWDRHFIDSAQIGSLLPQGQIDLYDLGSGAGFAGMVLAIIRSDIQVTLIESDSKKCAFLRTVSRETNIKVAIKNERIEAAVKILDAPDIVMARALASLPDLFKYAAPWAIKRPDVQLIFPKGGQVQAEIDAAKKAGWAFDFGKIQSKTDPAGRILTITNLRKIEG
jgi:16S rRNA (guanine527-N7)-methyltransferase